MAKGIKISGWVYVVPNKMYNNWVKKKLIPAKTSTIKCSEKNMLKIRQEVGKWYNKVFDYIYKWLNENDFIKLKSGSFSTGFCIESDPDREVVKDWGAPLANEGNKVVQVKEKFGSFRIYLMNMTEEDQKKIKKFEQHVRKKFDCETYFG